MAMKPVKIMAVIFFGLWLSGCAQTAPPKPAAPTMPPPEETKPSAPTDSSTSSETPESSQQAARQKSEPSEASSDASTGARQNTPGSPAAVESQSQQTLEKTESRPAAFQATAKDSAESRLARARENLRISEQTEKRIAADLEQLKKSGKASDEAVKDYENYLESVQAITAENRRMLEQMEAAYTDKAAGKAGPAVPDANKMKQSAGLDIPEEHTMDEVAALDRELDSSLAKFDDMLLKEMEKIQAGSSGKLQELAQEAADAARRLREKGLEVDTSGSESAPDSKKERTEEPKTGPEKESSANKTGTESATKEDSRKGGEGPSSTDQRRAGYEDDDIVARQLREAAEKETDPELKAKLWKEYEEYKKSK
jgi:hypothetical protein